jgi:hypothetical protein
MRKGAPWLKTTLIQCAWAAVATKGSYLLQIPPPRGHRFRCIADSVPVIADRL